MLDTVLEIGRALRDPDNREKGLRHHRYVQGYPNGEDENVLCLRIPVSSSYEIDLDGIEVLKNERVREKLFFLKYKSADADTFVKYVFGDIYFSQERDDFTGTSPGYYRLGDPDSGHPTFRKGSFDRGKGDADEVVARERSISSTDGQDSVIQGFRDGLEETVESTSHRKIDLIERLLRYQSGVSELLERGETVDTDFLLDSSRLQFAAAKRAFAEVKSGRGSKRRFRNVLDKPEPAWEDVKGSEEAIQGLSNYASGQIFLHFDIAGEHWYEQESAMQAIDQQFVSKFAESVSKGGFEGTVLKKYIYKTMASPESSLQIPDFRAQNQNRIRLFSEDELMDLFYAVDMAKTSKFRSEDVKVVVLPRGEDMSAEDVTRFMQGAASIEEAAEQEREFRGDTTTHDEEATVDQVLDAALSDAPGPIREFDLVFSEADSRGQDADLVELSGVSRSFLEQVRQQIKDARDQVQEKYERAMGQKLEPLNVYAAFQALLSGIGQDQPRYQRHLYRMLPKIYTETYYRDPLLLPSLIDRTEKAVRDRETPYFEFNRLHYYFRFLCHIQTTNPLMQINESTSYQLGKPLGVMARPLRSRINSFEKNYVGNLRRRITTLDDLIEFKNEIEEMLVRHEAAKMRSVDDARQQLSEHLSRMAENERIDKNRCALGFFESYFEPYEGDEDE
jgi:hypothetical protein